MIFESTIILDEEETKTAYNFFSLASKIGCEIYRHNCDECKFFEYCTKSNLSTFFPNVSFMVTLEGMETPM